MKVGVIGAGPSGLTTIKQLRDEGHDVVCLERNADIGGIWYRHPDDADETKAFDDLYLTISIKLMAFSDFMVEDRIIPTRAEYLGYLESYADKFGLRDCITFNSSVESVEKLGDRWHLSVTTDGHQNLHVVDALAVCCGPFQTPKTDIPGLERFGGEIIHSSRYRNNRMFRGKRVLVIGLAESGADIVRQISDVSAECTLSVRSHSYLLPRLFSGRYANDAYTFRAHHYEAYARATDHPFQMKAIFEDDAVSRSDFLAAVRLHGTHAAMEMAADRFDLRAFAATLSNTDAATAVSSGVARAVLAQPQPDGQHLDPRNGMGQPLYPLKLDLYTEMTQEAIDYINEWNRKSHRGLGTYTQRTIFCKNVTFVPNVLNGKIAVDDSGIRDVEGSAVYFNDHTAKDFDYVVLCTGFEHDFSLLRGVDIPGNNVRELYKHAFHPDHDGRLALIGFVRPFSGGIPICAEMQARYFAQMCSGSLSLPPDVRERIREERVWEEHWTDLSPRHFEAIPSQLMFLDSIAKEIGCLPTCDELIADPDLLVRLWFYSFNQSCYRLSGPHSMAEDARQSILNETLPGDTTIGMFYFMARSLLPSHVHPQHARLTNTGAPS